MASYRVDTIVPWTSLRFIPWLVILSLALSCRSDAPEPSTGQGVFTLLQPGEPVPSFEVLSSDSTRISIVDQNSVTLLNLWAPWCAPCLREFPDIERLHQAYKDQGLRILAVDVDPDPLSTVRKFAGELGATFTIAMDPSGNIQKTYRSMGLPTSYLIDSDGTLLELWTGILPEDVGQTLEFHLTPR